MDTSAQKIPSPPSFLNRLAKREWKRILPAMHAEGLATALDFANIGTYCALYARIAEAQAAIAAEGTVITLPSGRRCANPWCAVLSTAQRQMVTVTGVLGLSPGARKHVAHTDAWHAEQNRILNGR
jgi:P27 family predicted phage terminase small subunit